MDSGWVVTIPSLTSDFFNKCSNVTPGIGDTDSEVVGGLPINSVDISVADFGTTLTYSTVGVFRSNLGLDPSGLTPDLSLPIAMSTAVITTGTPLFTYQIFPTNVGTIPGGDTRVHSCVQFPVGDPRLAGCRHR